MTPLNRSRLGFLSLVLGRLVLAAIFLYAAYGKLRPIGTAPWTLASFKVTSASLNVSQMLFATQVDSYQLLPTWAVLTVARSLPWFELGLGILLITGLALRWFGLLTSILIAVFFGVLVHAYAAGLNINCGCFGPGAEPLTGWRLFVEALFLALAIAVTVGAFVRDHSRRVRARQSVVDFI